MKIASHTLVKNEQQWIWFALRSVIDWVDEAVVWDTGSSDNTVDIIKSFQNSKVHFKSVLVNDAKHHTHQRQAMLEQSDADWFIIVDGDEVWWRNSISQVIEAIHAHSDASAIISPFYNAVGDIWHYQNPSQINYQIHNWHGGYTLRAINRKIPGLHITNPHGRQEYRDGKEIPLQNLPLNQLVFVDAPYLHLTHLHRSSLEGDKSTIKRSFKYRYDLGLNFQPKIFPPEVFYYPRPTLVANPFKKRNFTYHVLAAAAMAARPVKRLLFPPPKSGY